MKWKVAHRSVGKNAESAPEKGEEQGADLHMNYQ
jgi:hypothetical protein